jgi:hypothetical protein
MTKIKYEVIFDQNRWLIMGGKTTTGNLHVIETFSANLLNKQRAYQKMAELRLIEAKRRKDLHRKLIGEQL